MTGPEHYLAAERLLRGIDGRAHHAEADALAVRAAHVHAMLASVALGAGRQLGNTPEIVAWQKATA